MSPSPAAVEHPMVLAHYQPQVRRGSHDVVGVEVLARWWDPEAGLHWPGEFLGNESGPGFERSITASILDLAVSAVSVWRSRVADLTVAVNVSAVDLNDTGLLGVVGRLLADAGCPGSSLVLEIAEDDLVALSPRARERVALLRAMDVKIVCDRAGGLGSLSPVVQDDEIAADVVKIDRSLVARLEDPRVRARVARIIASTHGAGCTAAAVGAETVDQVAILEDLGCEVVQGYAVSRPLRRSQVLPALATIGDVRAS